MAEDEKEALSLENESVHRVYDIIASHFSDTRYKVQISPRNIGNLFVAMATSGEVSERVASRFSGS